jgi:hypothetical protein
MMVEILVPLAPFAMTVAIVLTVFYFNSKNKRAILETVREASRNGQSLDPETIKALGMPEKKREGGDLKAGMILIAIAAALLVLGSAIATGEDESAFPILAAVASFPGFIGVVLVLFGVVNAANRKKQADLE